METHILTIKGYNLSEVVDKEIVMGAEMFLPLYFERKQYAIHILGRRPFPELMGVYEVIHYDKKHDEAILALVENEGLINKIYHLMEEKFLQ